MNKQEYLQRVINDKNLPARHKVALASSGYAVGSDITNVEVNLNWKNGEGYTSFYFDKDRNPNQVLSANLIVAGHIIT